MSMYSQINTGPDATIRDLMKAATQNLHDTANTLAGKALLKKPMSQQTYGAYLSGLYALYSTLEELMEKNKEHPSITPMYFPEELNRVPAIEHDLEYFLGDDWKNQIRELTSIKRYVAHLHDIASRRPELLIPHTYVRYFGDMSGGQFLRRSIMKMYKLPADGSGCEFYDFSHIAKVSDFKTLYASRFGEIPLSQEEKQDLIEEAGHAFNINIDFLREVIEIAETTPGGYQLTDADVTPEEPVQQPPATSLPSDNQGGWNVFSRLFKTSLFIIGSAVLVATLTKRP